MRRYLIANTIANEATTGEKLQSDKFVRSLESTLKMTAIDFTKAVFQTGYMKDPYDSSIYKKLESSVE